MLFQPADEIAPEIESLTAGKNLPQSVRRNRCQLLQKFIFLTVDVAEEGEIEWISLRGQAISLNVIGRLIVQNDETGEVNFLEVSEWNKCVVSVHSPRGFVHRVEKRAQLCFATRSDRRQHHEA